jgi:hypothetical protein
MEKKRSTSHRLSEEARQLLELLSQHWAISHTAALERLIRDGAKRERVPATPVR